MAGKRFRAEQIIMKLREAEVGLAQGQRVGQVSKQMGVSEQTYYRWRKEYGGRPCCMDHPEGCLIIVFFNTGDNLDAT